MRLTLDDFFLVEQKEKKRRPLCAVFVPPDNNCSALVAWDTLDQQFYLCKLLKADIAIGSNHFLKHWLGDGVGMLTKWGGKGVLKAVDNVSFGQVKDKKLLMSLCTLWTD